MRIIVPLASVVIFGFLAVQIYGLYSANVSLARKLDAATEESDKFISENGKLIADLEYFSEPDNLAKELKAKFDYKKPGEKLIKIQ